MATNDNGFKNEPAQPGPKDKRPRATLELAATDISPPEAKPQHSPQDAKTEAASGENETQSPASGGEAAPDAAPAPAPRRTAPGEVRGFFTHLAAGSLGGLIALLAAYAGVAGFRDRLPFLPEGDAAQLRQEVRQLAGRAGNFEKSLQEAAKTPISPEITESVKKTAALRSEVETFSHQIKDMEARLAALAARAANAEKKSEAGEGASLSGTAAQDSIKQAVEPLALRLAEAENTLKNVVQWQAERQSGLKGAALAIALGNLRRAAESGAAFAAELDAVRRLSPAKLETGPLDLRKNSGLTTLAALQQGFPALAKAALGAERERASGDGSLAGRLWSRARSAVSVRRVGMAEGETTEAVIARAETRLKAGDLAAAIKEMKALQGEGAVIMRPWIEDALARITVIEAIGRMEAGLLTTVSGAAHAGGDQTK